MVRSGGYLEVKPQYFEKIPVPIIDNTLGKELESLVTIIIEATKGLSSFSSRFKNLISSEFNLVKLPNKLNKWWLLEFSEFISAMKLKLSLQQKDELLSLFEKYRTECFEFDNEIRKTDHEIDQLVYKLYGLTEEEKASVEGQV
ncbi:MAG TPA: hypothetical protein VLG69_01430 [Candidatus Andersenbacteria bacterium]|nr:hypothetical protein [Candidatus Andersenbacteria bacterium]